MPVPAQVTDRGAAEDIEARVRIVFEGIVLDPFGAPAGDALVVSSAGGEAAADQSGKYRLAVEVPLDVRSVQITAVGGPEGKLVASTSVSLSGASRLAQVRPLQLTAGSACQPSWLPTFGSEPGMSNVVFALATYDDGSGPALYAGGQFRTAGGVPVNLIARWNGSSWEDVGGGVSSPLVSTAVLAMTVFDDGTGPALYVGGSFTAAGGIPANNIARWDGSSWQALGSGLGSSAAFDRVEALAVFPDDTGPALYAAGEFFQAGGVAKWNGADWAPAGQPMDAGVNALAVFDDGSVPALYAGGDFGFIGEAAVNRIAKWDGSSWTGLGGGLAGGPFLPRVTSLAVFDAGNGAMLHAAGAFQTAGEVAASNIASWNGQSWSPLGDGLNSQVESLTVFDVGSGAALYAGGSFTAAGGVQASRVARWDGSSWSGLGTGLDSGPGALLGFDDGSGPALWAGGFFAVAGGVPANRIARWDGSSWASLGSGLPAPVEEVVGFDDGTGSALYAAGSFTTAKGFVANRVARWDGTSWAALGSGMDGASDLVGPLAVFDDGSGPGLYAGGRFVNAGGVVVNNVARWDGSSWSALGSGVSNGVSALAVFDDGSGPALYAAGGFTSAGGVSANRIARWNGSGWSALGSGVGTVSSDLVFSLAVFDDGAGPALYAGGQFTSAGGVAASRIAKWNGFGWSALGSGVGSATFDRVLDMAGFDDGSGPALHVSGTFATAGGMPVNHIARWNGVGWAGLGGGLGGGSGLSAQALAVFDAGNGPALYVGGMFTTAGGLAANRIASWDGSSWTPVGSGTSATVFGLTVFRDRTGSALYAGGAFTSAFDSRDSYLAKWGCPDTNAPTLSCPAPIVVQERGGSPGEVVAFTVTALDEEDYAPSVVCAPPSGSLFPRGTTLVTCTAIDFSGNQTSCEFPVTVRPRVYELLRR